MAKTEKLKNRILKLNYLSIIGVVVVFSILSFASVYYVLNMSLQRDIEFTKQEYINSKKATIKNQVDNLINYINYISKTETQKKLERLKQDVEFLSDVVKNIPLEKLPMFFNRYIFEHSFYKVIVRENNKVIFHHGNLPEELFDYKPKGKIDIFIKNKKYYLYSKELKLKNRHYIIILALTQQDIDKMIQKKVINLVHTMQFVFNNGYISIIKIENFNGGKKFAKFVAYPKNHDWEGFYLNDDKKDAKGVEYRKEYLKLITTKGEGYFVYWFKRNGKLYKKISYVKLYKPYNWAIFGGIYIDEVNNLINLKKERIKNELREILKIYLIISTLFVVVVFLITKYENKLLKRVIEDYEKEISRKNKELEEVNKKLDLLNKNLKQEVERKTQELLKSYVTDKLTNLPNRERFLYDIKRNPNKCIGLLNIDSFKEINDFYGMEIGDKVLMKVGEFISKYTPVYKLSADEYGILGDDCNVVHDIVEKVIRNIEKNNIKIDGHEIEISLSAGIGESIEKADMALKYAKNKKMGKIVIFDENLEIVKNYKEYMEWKNIIKQALRDDKIIPYVQPIVDAKTKETKKYEVLLRLEHNGKIYPPFFLEHAKRAGLYVDLQKVMIKKSFEVFSKIDSKFSINLSVMELSNVSFKKYLLDMIDKYKVSEKLTIELLEDEKLMDEELLGFLIFLKEMVGVEIAIDDFGSGNSNISYLIRKMPVTILKLDGSLIKDMMKNENNKKLIQVIVSMAKIFELKTIAEFVENAEIAECLEKYGVDCLQGYYFSKPFDINNLKEKE